MLGGVEIKLSLPLVVPLVESIRNQAAKLRDSSGSSSASDDALRNAADVQCLLDIFPPDFFSSGRVTVGANENPAILRACAFLRFQLRHSIFADIPDAPIEKAARVDSFPEGKQDAFRCYAFLAELQSALLTNMELRSSLRDSERRPDSGLFALMKRLFSAGNRRNPGDQVMESPGGAKWEVVVLNDPVNLMPYVTAVLRSELGLTEDAARLHMKEVHELKSSRVWEGQREEAGALAGLLRGWHLSAIARPK